MSARNGFVVLSLALSILIGVSLSRSGSTAASSGVDDGWVIGLSMDTLKEARWQRDRDLFVGRAEELGARVLVQSANSDDTRQIQDVKSLLSNGVDVLVVIPHDGVAMAEAVRLAHQAEVPVIAYDRLIRDSELDLYLSFDNVRVGEIQAQFLVDRLGGRGKLVRIYGAPTDNNARLFKEGQDNVLGPYIARGDIEVLHEDWADDWSPANAKKIMNAAITSHGREIAAVLASNDGTAGGAIQALKEAERAGAVIVTGQDAELVACQRIMAGTQAMTVYKPVHELARRAAELAFDLARGKPVVANGAVENGATEVPSVLLGVVSVTRENMMETVVADGFHSAEAVSGSGDAG